VSHPESFQTVHTLCSPAVYHCFTKTLPLLPVFTGPAVASFVSKRTTQKAELVQYLEAHSGSVRAMLNSGDGTAAQQQQQQQNETDWYAGEGQIPLRGSSDTCVSPHAVASSAAGVDDFFNTRTNRRSSQLASVGPQAAAAVTAGGASPSSARRASVSAYLQGQQDLDTTVSTGVPYLGSANSSPRAGRASDAYAAAAAGSAGAGPSSPSNSRHTVIKEALNARLSDAGEGASTAAAAVHTSQCVSVGGLVAT
jgi:hypothetical protein